MHGFEHFSVLYKLPTPLAVKQLQSINEPPSSLIVCFIVQIGRFLLLQIQHQLISSEQKQLILISSLKPPSSNHILFDHCIS
jgi:hypothetical protein